VAREIPLRAGESARLRDDINKSGNGPLSLGFDSDVADSTDDVVGGGLALFDGHDFNGIGLVVGAQNQVSAGSFHIFHGALLILQHGIHVELALTIGFERVIVAVNEESGPGLQARVHAHAFAAVHLDDNETLPPLAVALGFCFQPLEKTFLEFQDFFDVHAGEEGLGGGDSSVGQKDVLKLVVAGRQDGGALIDLGGVEQIEHGEVLNGEDAIHTFEAQAALAIQEVGDMSLFESSLLCQTEAGQIPFINALPKGVAQVVLEHSEFHGWSIACDV